MNSYTVEFFARCPTNGVRVKYTLRIETPAATVLPAEQLVAQIEALESGEPVYHEEIADRLAAEFPGRHTMRAHHHGVDIETVRTGCADEGGVALPATPGCNCPGDGKAKPELHAPNCPYRKSA